jgi:amino acid transporter
VIGRQPNKFTKISKHSFLIFTDKNMPGNNPFPHPEPENRELKIGSWRLVIGNSTSGVGNWLLEIESGFCLTIFVFYGYNLRNTSEVTENAQNKTKESYLVDGLLLYFLFTAICPRSENFRQNRRLGQPGRWC